MNIYTQLVQFDAAPGDPAHPSATPIYQTATFEQESATEFGAYDYSRSGNPTRDVLQAQLARIENAFASFAFVSGMAATGALVALVKSGEEILIGDDIYGGTYRYMLRVASEHGISFRQVDTTNLEAVRTSLTSKTRLLIMETPTNPTMRISDLRALSKICHENGTWLAVDCSMLSPYVIKPLELGVDFAVHSATKPLAGHGDVTAGVISCASPDLAERIGFLINAQGTALGPMDCYLFLRGLKTLALRMDRQQANAMKIAEFLNGNASIKKVFYPGLGDHPGHDLHFSQASGPGAIIAVALESNAEAVTLVEQTKLFRTTVSFGSVTSSISLPFCMSHASIPEDERKKRAFSDNLVRLSIGIEDPEDLIADLSQALAKTKVEAAVR